jgi:hypothetical protein
MDLFIYELRIIRRWLYRKYAFVAIDRATAQHPVYNIQCTALEGLYTTRAMQSNFLLKISGRKLLLAFRVTEVL